MVEVVDCCTHTENAETRVCSDEGSVTQSNGDLLENILRCALMYCVVEKRRILVVIVGVAVPRIARSMNRPPNISPLGGGANGSAGSVGPSRAPTQHARAGPRPCTHLKLAPSGDAARLAVPLTRAGAAYPAFAPHWGPPRNKGKRERKSNGYREG